MKILGWLFWPQWHPQGFWSRVSCDLDLVTPKSTDFFPYWHWTYKWKIKYFGLKCVHKTLWPSWSCDLDLWPYDPKINRNLHLLIGDLYAVFSTKISDRAVVNAWIACEICDHLIHFANNPGKLCFYILLYNQFFLQLCSLTDISMKNKSRQHETTFSDIL